MPCSRLPPTPPPTDDVEGHKLRSGRADTDTAVE
jgi:hypothetical protein